VATKGAKWTYFSKSTQKSVPLFAEGVGGGGGGGGGEAQKSRKEPGSFFPNSKEGAERLWAIVMGGSKKLETTKQVLLGRLGISFAQAVRKQTRAATQGLLGSDTTMWSSRQWKGKVFWEGGIRNLEGR